MLTKISAGMWAETWAESCTKLLALNRTDYACVLHIDSDSSVLQPMDELFPIPFAAVAKPRSHWEKQPKLSSQLMPIEPSAHEFARLERAIAELKPNAYDMEILNSLYGSTALVLSHRTYNLPKG